MSLGLNNWNNNQQVRDRMENDALEYQLRETDPEQAMRGRNGQTENTARKESASPDMTLWESQWQKGHPLREKGLKKFAIFALIGVLCVAFIWWRYSTDGSGSVEEKQADFTAYVFELMEEYKPDFVLYEQLADPWALLQEEGWQVMPISTDQPDEPVRQLLGEGCVIQSWEELKQAEADRMWQEWYYGDEEIRSDVFIIRELSLHIDHHTLPGLRENSWLVYSGQGDKYILIHADGTWAVRLLMWGV